MVGPLVFRQLIISLVLLACVISCQCVIGKRLTINSVKVVKGGEGRANVAGVGAAQKRRARETSSCGLSSTDILEMEPQELSEKAEAIQAVWVGHDEILIVASDKVLRGHSTVWRGMYKASIGIMKFEADHDAIGVPVMADSLQVSPAGQRATVVVVSLDRQSVLVSRDYGKNFNQYKAPTVNFDPTEELYLSSSNPRHMVIRSRSGELWISDNCGRDWSFITSHVQLVEFVQVVEGGTEYVYYSVSSDSHSFNPLYRMDITSRHSVVVDNSAYRFRVDNRYLFVSRKNSTGNKDADLKSRRLYVTNNYTSDNIKFSEVQLPSLEDEQFYVVMATHESGAFIHVYQGTNEIWGNLYVSDSSGSRFSLSLANHLYQVYQHPMGHFSVHDFYEVASLRGVYITTVVDTGGHVTKITFDNGGLWSPLTPPTGSCERDNGGCSLHLHLRYSQMISSFYNSSRPKGPLSIKSAPMIVIAHGTVGTVRDDSGKTTKVYVSNDGGYTWKDPSLPFGTYVYGIADYGNIIAVASDTNHMQQIWFSHDRGNCFVQRRVDTTGVFQLNRGLLFDPSAASLLGYLMGVEGTGDDDEWRVITLNFLSLLKRPCQAKDYVVTEEHSSNKNCLMGYRYSYKLVEANSICYSDKQYDYLPVRRNLCSCTYSDYECDYGFNRTSDTACSTISRISLADVCPPGSATYQQSSSGFRQIPGDKCSATTESKKILELLTLPCTGHEQDSGFRVHSHSSTGLTIFLAILIVLLSVLAASVLLYIWLKCRARGFTREKVYYQHLPRDESNKFASSNDSSSDEDLITAT